MTLKQAVTLYFLMRESDPDRGLPISQADLMVVCDTLTNHSKPKIYKENLPFKE